MVYDQGIAIVFQKLWKNIDLPSLVNGKLALSVTRLAWDKGVTFPYLKDEIVTEFHSNQDLLECVIASALIPFALNGKPYVIYRNWICADGGITNVTGVRHFAEELVHDIELIEEELVEQAHQLTDDFVHTLQDEILYRGSADQQTNKQPRRRSSSVHRHLPITTGPKDIIQFGVTVSMTIIDVITDSLERLLESRKRSPFPQSSHPETEHLLYRPTPLLLSTLEQHESHLLQQVISAVHPSCEKILERLHKTSTRLHDRYDHLSEETALTQQLTLSSSPNNLTGTLSSLCHSVFSSLTGKTPFFPDALLPISEIYSQESHWLGNHFSSYCEMQELLDNHHSTDIPTYLIANKAESEPITAETLRTESNDNSVKSDDPPASLSQTNSLQHLECKDYQEEDEEDSELFRSSQASINDCDVIEVDSAHVTSSLFKIFPNCSDSTKSSSTHAAPGVGSVDCHKTVISQENSSIAEVEKGSHRRNEHSEDYWKRQGDIIKQIPNGGGIQLEISPWMWRHHSIWNYHLSADPMNAIKLFNMGINDAFDHHEELKRFFDS